MARLSGQTESRSGLSQWRGRAGFAPASEMPHPQLIGFYVDLIVRLIPLVRKRAHPHQLISRQHASDPRSREPRFRRRSRGDGGGQKMRAVLAGLRRTGTDVGGHDVAEVLEEADVAGLRRTRRELAGHAPSTLRVGSRCDAGGQAAAPPCGGCRCACSFCKQR